MRHANAGPPGDRSLGPRPSRPSVGRVRTRARSLDVGTDFEQSGSRRDLGSRGGRCTSRADHTLRRLIVSRHARQTRLACCDAPGRDVVKVCRAGARVDGVQVQSLRVGHALDMARTALDTLSTLLSTWALHRQGQGGPRGVSSSALPAHLAPTDGGSILNPRSSTTASLALSAHTRTARCTLHTARARVRLHQRTGTALDPWLVAQ